MRFSQSLTFRLLLVISAALLTLSIGMLIISNQKVRSILDQSQTDHYQQQIDAILNSLQIKEERLQATGLPDAYRSDFQKSAIRNLRATYYLRNDQQRVPIIFTLQGKVIMHPTLKTGQSLDKQGWDIDRVRQMRNGQFVHSHGEFNNEWHIFKLFKPWDWVVGFSVSDSIKYAQANALLRYLALAFCVIVIPIGVLLSIYIRQQLKPIHDLTDAATHMRSGNLDHPLPQNQSGELGVLTRSFSLMRDQIQRELDQRREKAERGQAHQQALLTLSRSTLLKNETTEAVFPLVAEQVEMTMSCGRVSIWRMDDEENRLECAELYEAQQGHLTSTDSLTPNAYPAYFTAIRTGQPVAVESAGTDPITSELSDYLQSKNISSLLDVPIRTAGKVRGIICIEQLRVPRSWQKDEIDFVVAIAELISQAITQQDNRSAAEEITRLRQELADIVDSMPSILIGVNNNLIVRHWNHEAEKITGVSASAARGEKIDKVLKPLAAHLGLVTDALKLNLPQIRRKISWDTSGRQDYYDLTIYPLREANKTGAVIRIDKVTERVQLEEMMVQTEKMLSVGGLAAGMAHEINNPLAGIMQNTQVIRNRLDSNSAKNTAIAKSCGIEMAAIASYIEKRGLLPMFDALTESGNRAARIVDNMLSFSRKSESKHAPQDLKLLIERTLELAKNDYDLKKNYDFRKIQIRLVHDDQLQEVPCTGTEIQQVFLNLLKNSAQAMSSDSHCTQPVIDIITRKENANAVIEIKDNGPGIKEELRRRIFEPFFTTKGVGVGTGLGLSVSYFIIREKHHGSLEVVSSPSVGTTFIIRLPLVAEFLGAQI